MSSIKISSTSVRRYEDAITTKTGYKKILKEITPFNLVYDELKSVEENVPG
jgi:hypothetical protein